MINDSSRSEPDAPEGQAGDPAVEPRMCAGCGQPVKDDDRSVECREVIGLQEFKSWHYHAACVPRDV